MGGGKPDVLGKNAPLPRSPIRGRSARTYTSLGPYVHVCIEVTIWKLSRGSGTQSATDQALPYTVQLVSLTQVDKKTSASAMAEVEPQRRI
ncbi:hypothetical protein J6590_019188 [Homalodisca vitripennis]|nr:hypothetical protein J6590_019188 [Homalodisca vitripennis]